MNKKRKQPVFNTGKILFEFKADWFKLIFAVVILIAALACFIASLYKLFN